MEFKENIEYFENQIKNNALDKSLQNIINKNSPHNFSVLEKLLKPIGIIEKTFQADPLIKLKNDNSFFYKYSDTFALSASGYCEDVYDEISQAYFTEFKTCDRL